MTTPMNYCGCLAAIGTAVLVACSSTSGGGYTCGPGTAPINGVCTIEAVDAGHANDAAADGPIGTPLGTLCTITSECPAPLALPPPLIQPNQGPQCTPGGCSFLCTDMCGTISCAQACSEIGGTCNVLNPNGTSNVTYCSPPGK